MAWATDLTQLSNLRFNRLRNRLLLFYFLAITAILVFFATVIYVLVSRDRQQQFDQQLQQIGTSAAGIWEVVYHEYEELTTIQAYWLTRQAATRPHRFIGNLIAPALYNLTEVLLEGRVYRTWYANVTCYTKSEICSYF
ncbi:hypothetical protein L5470_04695 [Synechococcus sp. PCC 6717]|nr:hypothetical protein [Synechococcus sp. PCC 6717]